MLQFNFTHVILLQKILILIIVHYKLSGFFAAIYSKIYKTNLICIICSLCYTYSYNALTIFFYSPVANYIKCAKTIIHEKCGEVAGNLTMEYVRRSSGEQMDSVCQKLPGYPEPSEEMCKSSPPVCTGGASSRFNFKMVMGTISMLLLYLKFMNSV